MMLTRRAALGLALAAIAVAAAPARLLASLADKVREFTGGAEPVEGEGVALTTPEIAENGNTVPIAVSAPGASEIALFAAGNPEPGVATVRFGPAAGSRSLSTRIRLAETQDIIAVAKMEDGSFVRTSANIKVTIGGCGG